MKKLNEELKRIRSVMGLKESKFIANINLIETSDEADVAAPSVKAQSDSPFPDSEVQKIVWRAGSTTLDPMAGGIWFAESKKDVETFALSVFNEVRTGKPYHVNITKAFRFDSFWDGYIDWVGRGDIGRFMLRNGLMSDKYDGIIIAHDCWNDDPDYMVCSEQYIVFNEDQIRPA